MKSIEQRNRKQQRNKVRQIFQSVREKYGIHDRSFTEDDFYHICREEKIELVIKSFSDRSRVRNQIKGMFFVRQSKPGIWLTEFINNKIKLSTAFHELGHYFLRHSSPSYKIDYAEDSLHEYEANYFSKLARRSSKISAKNLSEKVAEDETETKEFSLPASKVNNLFYKISIYAFLREHENMDSVLNHIHQVHGKRFRKATRQYDVFSEPFTIKQFYKICSGEGLTVSRSRKYTVEDFNGFYCARRNLIWLRPYLRKDELLRIMAHELSHHFLHREDVLSGKTDPSLHYNEPNDEIRAEHLRHELEAELFACVFLIDKTKGGENE